MLLCRDPCTLVQRVESPLRLLTTKYEILIHKYQGNILRESAVEMTVSV